ncbi:MAG TPA: 30S ribosomal protein S4, partial [Candidatus Norongarragalinales archaeon]|nr:30S ribosomal protein S4 [Candidatus Norongarragalinales archaeon]
MRRLAKKFEKPRKIWSADRIKQEGGLVNEYGLKNMTELWRLQTVLRTIRRNARSLLAKKDERKEKEVLNRAKTFLVRKPDATLDDILSLSQRDILERRLQTRVWKNGLSATALQARQFITHGHIAISGKRVNSPGYLVPFGDEAKIGWYGKEIKLESMQKEEAPV